MADDIQSDGIPSGTITTNGEAPKNVRQALLELCDRHSGDGFAFLIVTVNPETREVVAGEVFFKGAITPPHLPSLLAGEGEMSDELALGVARVAKILLGEEVPDGQEVAVRLGD